MKKITLLSIAIALVFAGCTKKSDDTATTPCNIIAGFTYTVDTVARQIVFTNSSSAEATTFAWTFGDNATSVVKAPTHKYAGAGTFSVKLTATSADGKCTKDVTQTINVPFSAVPTPTTFTKKVMLEEFTGAWCGYCPRGATESDNIATAKGSKFIPVAIHSGSSEIMKIPGGAAIDALFNNYGYPGGMIDRLTGTGSPDNTMATNYWSSKTTTELALTAQIGLGVDASKMTADTATISIYTACNAALTGNYTLNVYIVEGSVKNTNAAYDQHNYMGMGCSSPDPSSPWYSFPCTINNFEHKHVLRAVLSSTAVAGDALPASAIAAGGRYSQTYKLGGLSTMDKADLYVVTFIDKTSSARTGHQVQNVQEVKLGSIKNWD